MPRCYRLRRLTPLDRGVDLSALAGRRFDRVVDCAGYDPAVVALSASVLRDAVDRYVFVSSVSVYADQSTPPVEGAAVLEDDSCGGRKAACERVVLDGYGDRALIARPGLIVGPHDPTVADVIAWDTARGGPREEPLSAHDERRLLAGR